ILLDQVPPNQFLYIPNPSPYLLMSTVLCAYSEGVGWGLFAATVSVVYAVYHFTVNDSLATGVLFHFNTETYRRFLITVLVTPVTAILVGKLKELKDHLAERQQQLETLTAELQKKNVELMELSQAKSHFVSIVSHE